MACTIPEVPLPIMKGILACHEYRSRSSGEISYMRTAKFPIVLLHRIELNTAKSAKKKIPARLDPSAHNSGFQKVSSETSTGYKSQISGLSDHNYCLENKGSSSQEAQNIEFALNHKSQYGNYYSKSKDSAVKKIISSEDLSKRHLQSAEPSSVTPNKSFSTEHFKVCRSDKTYKCAECPYESRRLSYFKKHLLRHLLKKDHYKCGKCSYVTTSVRLLEKHSKFHEHKNLVEPKCSASNPLNISHSPTNGMKFKCKKCSYESVHYSNVKSHERFHLDKPCKCKLCSYASKDECDLKVHSLMHSDKTKLHETEKTLKLPNESKICRGQSFSDCDEKFKCQECPFVTAYLSSLNDHKTTHSDERPYKCPECCFAFKRKNTLTNHSRIHLSEKIFKCEKCSFTTNYKATLNNHLRNNVCDGGPHFNCNECPFSSEKRKDLLLHSKLHKDVVLPYCPRSKNNRSNLHHTSKRVYKCEECPYSSISKSSLRKHLKLHSLEKPYKCQKCPYASKRKSNLTVHSLIHTGKKYFKCKDCDFETNQKFYLRVHSRRHNQTSGTPKL